MFKQLLCAALATLLMTSSSPGQELSDLENLPPLEWGPTELNLPSGRTHTSQPDVVPSPALTKLIMSWLSSNFDLPGVADPPRIELALTATMEALRYRGLASGRQTRAAIGQNDAAPPDKGRDVIAIYDDVSKTIYLPQGWSGKTPTEVSLLLHEMVHHLQNIGGLQFECSAAREKTAYTAQEYWLGM